MRNILIPATLALMFAAGSAGAQENYDHGAVFLELQRSLHTTKGTPSQTADFRYILRDRIRSAKMLIVAADKTLAQCTDPMKLKRARSMLARMERLDSPEHYTALGVAQVATAQNHVLASVAKDLAICW